MTTCRLFRHQRICQQRVANNLFVLFDVERAVVEADAGAAGRALLDARAETFDDIGITISFVVLERDQKATRRRGVLCSSGPSRC